MARAHLHVYLDKPQHDNIDRYLDFQKKTKTKKHKKPNEQVLLLY